MLFDFNSINQGKQFRNSQKKIFEGYENQSVGTQSQKTGDDITLTDQQIEDLNNLKDEYNSVLDKIKDVQKKATEKINNYISRTSTDNPYLNKNVKTNNGMYGYVTNKGELKWYQNNDIYQNTAGKNGCPALGNETLLDFDFRPTMLKPGTTISEVSPSLLVSTPMKEGQSCGYEGTNVFVSNIVTNPTSSYKGCYNNRPAVSNILIVPVLNSSNNTNGYISKASSLYKNNNNYGAWKCFDQNSNTYWHSKESSTTGYDSKSGMYSGTSNSADADKVLTMSAGLSTIKGEWVEIDMPTSTSFVLTSYEILGRQDGDLYKSRSPNTWYIVGMKDGQWYQIDYQENQTFDKNLKKYTINDPQAYTAYKIIVTRVGNNDQTSNRYCVQIASWNLYTTTDYNLTDSELAMQDSGLGYTSYDTCQKYAIDNGYKFFGLQDAQADGSSSCFVSNDITSAQMYGEPTTYDMVPLWSSNTYDSGVTTMTLTNSGSIVLTDSAGNTVFETPADNSCVNGYTYSAKKGSDDNNIKTIQNYSLDKCKKDCDKNVNCVGIVFHTDDNTCGLKSKLRDPLQDASNKEVYAKILSKSDLEGCVYSLVLQDDGNMCIYKNGSSNFVWSSQTNGKQMNQNQDWFSNKGKNGKNTLTSGESLFTGEWIGSNDGTLKLIMQSDGNLVLYASSTKEGCKKQGGNGSEIMSGSGWVNAVYEINNPGYPSNFGKVGYVNNNSKLFAYPSSNVGVSNQYLVFKDYDSSENSINSLLEGQTVETCKEYCNQNDDCYGFTFSDDKCMLKNKNISSVGQRQIKKGTDLYYRVPSVNKSLNNNSGVSNIDSIQWENYLKFDNFGIGSKTTSTSTKTEGFIGSSIQSQELNNLQTRLDLLASNINEKVNNLKSKSLTANQQMKLNNVAVNTQNKELVKVLEKLKNNTNFELTNINGILRDSDIVVLQENYSYLLWSIFAIGTVVLTMNSLKK